MNRHLVLGAAGFLGRHLARALAAHGRAVLAVDARPGADPDALVRDLAHLDPAGWDGLVRGVDVVHHCAWTSVPESAEAAPAADLGGNLATTIGLLEALRRRGGGRVVFPSSGGTVYGRARTLPIPEDHPLRPINAYGAAKVAAETYLGLYRRAHGVDARVLRVANLYGAGQDPRRGQGAVTTFVHRCLAGEPIEVWGDGTVERDFVHVADVVAAFLAVAEGASQGPSRGASRDAAARGAPAGDEAPVHNVGGGRRCAVRAVLALVEAAVGRPADVRWHPGRAFDVPTNELAIGRAARELGWAPRVGLEEGIARTVAAARRDA